MSLLVALSGLVALTGAALVLAARKPRTATLGAMLSASGTGALWLTSGEPKLAAAQLALALAACVVALYAGLATGADSHVARRRYGLAKAAGVVFVLMLAVPLARLLVARATTPAPATVAPDNPSTWVFASAALFTMVLTALAFTRRVDQERR